MGMKPMTPLPKQTWMWMVAFLIFAYWFGSRFLAYSLKRAVESFEPASATPVIPLHIYQTWHTKKLPERMQEWVDKLQRMNPEFTHHLYDDADCEQFIRKHYGEDVAKAYTTLVPEAYKADLWRYCVLHQNGGIYLDVKFCTIGSVRLSELVDKEYFVRDTEVSTGGVANGFMVCRPGNPKLWNCIQRIVENVKNRFYGDNPLEPTGPLCLKREFTEDELSEMRREMELKVSGDGVNKNLEIVWNGRPILEAYKGYYHSDNRNDSQNYYANKWKNRTMYGESPADPVS